ncbi:MAG: hypothetical protein ACYCZY_08215 [Lacisediminihabitans sp.]
MVALVVYFALIVPINYLKRVSFRKKHDGASAPTEVVTRAAGVVPPSAS